MKRHLKEPPVTLNADQYNPYVGKSSCTTCATCRATGSGTLAEYCPDSTSALGDAYCTLPWIDVTCGGGALVAC